MTHEVIESILKTPVEAEVLRSVEVAIPLPIQNAFSYLLEPDQIPKAKVGVRVRVPFKNREIVGFLVGLGEAKLGQKLKKVSEILDDEPVLSIQMLRMTEWLSQYYFSSWGEAIEAAVPSWVKQGKRWREKPSPYDEAPVTSQAKLTLTSEQEKAFAQIKKSLQSENPSPILIYGVTGSGKTELYIRTIKEVLARGKGVIVLVPEIALTEQIRLFFSHHFGPELEILHSKLTDSERFSAWKRIEAGKKRVLLGPRSAIFAPLDPLGLILIDEEHENSYKQEQSPRYHAREVAIWRAREEKALLILGSATPSLESMYFAAEGVFSRIDLTKRVENKELPRVEIVDLKREREIQKRPVILSRRLAQEIESNLKHKEGTLLLLNRRGFSTQVHCPDCGEVISCRSCEVSLTYHQEDNQLLCHYCNFRTEPPQVCGKCSKPLLRFSGFGTEKVESEVGRLFPQARIARIDTDTMRQRGSHERILRDFRSENLDILVGTQMIAKGFDFQHVTLVGVVLADTGLILPDFRSSERTFQLLTQVAGRAGRGSKPGRVIIQTYSPSHPSVTCAQTHDYNRFYQQEVAKRIELGYPPARHMVNVLIRSRIEKKAYLFAKEYRAILQKQLESKENLSEEKIEIIGPAPLPFYRLRGHYRWHVLIRAKEMSHVQALLREGTGKQRRPSGVSMQIDVNPMNIL